MESLEGEGFAGAAAADLLCWQNSGGIHRTVRVIISQHWQICVGSQTQEKQIVL